MSARAWSTTACWAEICASTLRMFASAEATSGQERGRSDPFNWYQRGDVLPLASGVRRVEERPGEAAEGPGNGEHPAASCGVGSDTRQADPAGGIPGKLLSPARRRACIEHVRGALSISERRACAALGQHRSTQRKIPHGRDDEARLTADIVELVRQYGRYGYRKIAELLRQAGWLVNDKRVERIWRREGLKVPTKQPKRGRLWLNDGSCVRLRPERPNHVWSYDFVQDRTQDGRAFRMLVVLDEFTRRCLAIVVARRLRSDDVLQCLTDLFVTHGPPEHIRSDNGPEFVAINVRAWLGRIGVRTLYIEPGSPWENGYCESLNSKLRDELLNGEIFTTLREAQVLIENWRRHYNAVRPHSSLRYRPPAPEAILPPASGLPYAPLRPDQTLANHGAGF